MTMSFAGKTAVAGIGATEFSKNSGRSTLRLAVECCDTAIREAGLTPDQVDGMVSFTTDENHEIDVARSDLEAALGARIDEVAIPFGRYNRRVIAKLWQARFERIHTSDGGLTIPEAKVWNRNTLRNDMDEAVLHKTLSGQWSRAQNLKRAVRSMMKRHVF